MKISKRMGQVLWVVAVAMTLLFFYGGALFLCTKGNFLFQLMAVIVAFAAVAAAYLINRHLGPYVEPKRSQKRSFSPKQTI